MILAEPSSSYNNDKSKPASSKNNDKPRPLNVENKNGSIEAYNGNFLVAKKHLERAVRFSPKNPDDYNLWGYSY